MIARKEHTAHTGYRVITDRMHGPHADMLMDFGTLTLGPQDRYVNDEKGDERAFVLIQGEVTLMWGAERATITRTSFLDERPWVLHVPADVQVLIEAGAAGADMAIAAVRNPDDFPPRLYDPASCRADHFGAGTMQETSTREVRTVFDAENAPRAMMVLGEVINHPGKWSSYPPHAHRHPEIYHYRFVPEQGMGVSLLGKDAFIVRSGDTSCIPGGITHSQCSAPGYAMYYIWIIPHLPEDIWTRAKTDFDPEHVWVREPDAEIWEPRQ